MQENSGQIQHMPSHQQLCSALTSVVCINSGNFSFVLYKNQNGSKLVRLMLWLAKNEPVQTREKQTNGTILHRTAFLIPFLPAPTKFLTITAQGDYDAPAHYRSVFALPATPANSLTIHACTVMELYWFFLSSPTSQGQHVILPCKRCTCR